MDGKRFASEGCSGLFCFPLLPGLFFSSEDDHKGSEEGEWGQDDRPTEEKGAEAGAHQEEEPEEAGAVPEEWRRLPLPSAGQLRPLLPDHGPPGEDPVPADGHLQVGQEEQRVQEVHEEDEVTRLPDISIRLQVMKRAAGELLARAPGMALPASLPLPWARRGRAPPVPPRPSQSFLPRPQPSRIPPPAFS